MRAQATMYLTITLKSSQQSANLLHDPIKSSRQSGPPDRRCWTRKDQYSCMITMTNKFEGKLIVNSTLSSEGWESRGETRKKQHTSSSRSLSNETRLSAPQRRSREKLVSGFPLRWTKGREVREKQRRNRWLDLEDDFQPSNSSVRDPSTAGVTIFGYNTKEVKFRVRKKWRDWYVKICLWLDETRYILSKFKEFRDPLPLTYTSTLFFLPSFSL